MRLHHLQLHPLTTITYAPTISMLIRVLLSLVDPQIVGGSIFASSATSPSELLSHILPLSVGLSELTLLPELLPISLVLTGFE